LKEADIAFGAVNSVLDLAHHPHLRRVMVMTPGGKVSLPAPPAVRPGHPVAFGPVPALGQNSDALRLEFASLGDRP
jgi:formyl-CoA transferase